MLHLDTDTQHVGTCWHAVSCGVTQLVKGAASGGSRLKSHHGKPNELQANTAPVDVIHQCGSEVVSDERDSGVEQRPCQRGGDASSLSRERLAQWINLHNSERATE